MSISALRKAQLSITVFLAGSVAASLGAAVDIQFDFTTYDSSNFFVGHPDRQAVLEAAAQVFETKLADNLTAITPGGSNTWTAQFNRPDTGATTSVVDMNVGAGVVKVFVGARDLGTGVLGLGGYGGISSGSGTQAFIDSLDRGQLGVNTNTDFGPWGGTVAFSSTANWYFDSNVSTVESFPGQSDFYSVAIHELGHLFGIGTASSWDQLVSGSKFTGPACMALNGGVGVTLNAGLDHWAEGTMSSVDSPIIIASQEASMDPSLLQGTRKYFTKLDYAALDDIGWDVIPEPGSAMLLISGLFIVTRRRRTTV